MSTPQATTTTTLRAFHGDPELKARLLVELQLHRDMDAIVKGTYGEWAEDDSASGQFRGDVGCTLHSLGMTENFGDHDAYPELLGIPTQLAHLFDSLFESLPEEDSKNWPIRHMEATPVGADLSSVWPRFTAWMMLDPTYGLVNITEVDDVKDVCRRVGKAYERIATGDSLTAEEEQSITDAAWAARAARAAFVFSSADKLCELLASAPIVES